LSEVIFIGTSDAFGAGGRRQSAILVRAEAGSVLLDCGMTTGSGLHDLGVSRDEIDAILVSHYHGDHFGGIPPLLLACLYEDRRVRPLSIAGPPGIEERVRSLAASLGFQIEGRDWPFEIRFEELRAGKLTSVGPVTATAFETHHQQEVMPHGLAVQAGERRIVFSGDTGWFDELPAHAAGADLFICECTNLEPVFEYHLSLEEMTERIGEFDCGRIVLTHLGEAMSERRQDCELETADDGLIIRL
jgi:ribonuclease BN (tRNA processing enzyme)